MVLNGTLVDECAECDKLVVPFLMHMNSMKTGSLNRQKWNLSLLQQKRTDTLAQFNNILFVFTSTLINDIDLFLEFFSVQVF